MCVFRLLCCHSVVLYTATHFCMLCTSVSLQSSMKCAVIVSLCRDISSICPFLCERRIIFSLLLVCEYELSTCIDISFIHKHLTWRKNKKCLQNVRLCNSSLNNQIDVLNIGHSHTNDTLILSHIHVFRICWLWFNKLTATTIATNIYIRFVFGIFVVAAFFSSLCFSCCRPLSHSQRINNKCPSCGATLCQNLELIAIYIHFSDIARSHTRDSLLA